MPANPRVRNNNVRGTLTDNPLTAGALTMNSAGLANLEAVATEHAVLTLDPLRAVGAPEYVIVTAHTGAATSATITRGAYGSVARSHALGTLWVHAPLDEDFIELVTAATRPSDPYEGQGIYETDTNKLVFYTGADWAYRDAGGQLGYAEVTASQTGITTLADLTGLTVTVTVATGRRIKITGHIATGRTVSDGHNRLYIREGATTLQVKAADVQDVASGFIELTCFYVTTPSAGSHTYKLSLERTSGTGTSTLDAGATSPAFILVEDIGAA